jgi:hypothetical protein
MQQIYALNEIANSFGKLVQMNDLKNQITGKWKPGQPQMEETVKRDSLAEDKNVTSEIIENIMNVLQTTNYN